TDPTGHMSLVGTPLSRSELLAPPNGFLADPRTSAASESACPSGFNFAGNCRWEVTRDEHVQVAANRTCHYVTKYKICRGSDDEEVVAERVDQATCQTTVTGPNGVTTVTTDYPSGTSGGGGNGGQNPDGDTRPDPNVECVYACNGCKNDLLGISEKYEDCKRNALLLAIGVPIGENLVLAGAASGLLRYQRARNLLLLANGVPGLGVATLTVTALSGGLVYGIARSACTKDYDRDHADKVSGDACQRALACRPWPLPASCE
ncbi:MAG TPA: hypothetical protein VGF45_16160, partial [Polyangia bacterium]